MTDFVRTRLRAYGAALLLSAATINMLPEFRVTTPTAIVRQASRRGDLYDPTEIVGAQVMTVPHIVVSWPDVGKSQSIAHLN